MATLNSLSNDVEAIKKRNLQVEKDKAWETSFARKGVVFGLTYVFIVVFMLVNGLPKPYVNSLIPALAFVLSTLTLSWAKKFYS
jgi:hypothetical protein|tara:strand:- start:282 stop:533 length:252 start_codon:yes stop_codon:yes gene_type:complete